MKTFLAWSNGFMMGAMAVLIAQKIDEESKKQQTTDGPGV